MFGHVLIENDWSHFGAQPKTEAGSLRVAFMAVKGEIEQEMPFVSPPSDPYLIGIAKAVDEGLAMTQPGVPM